MKSLDFGWKHNFGHVICHANVIFSIQYVDEC